MHPEGSLAVLASYGLAMNPAVSPFHIAIGDKQAQQQQQQQEKVLRNWLTTS
jgi:hypothetical protein